MFVSHDLGVVARVADRVAVMYAGKIVEIGTAEEIFYDPRHPYTWALLRALPAFAKGKERLCTIPGTPPTLIDLPQGDAFAWRNERPCVRGRLPSGAAPVPVSATPTLQPPGC